MSSIYKALTKKLTGGQEKPVHINRQRVLLISLRGVTYRHRHLIADLHAMMPHGRKEPKLDTKKTLYELNEVAELYNCNNIMFFEARKHTDLYLWMLKPPNGPTVKFHVQNMHTTDELNFTGNCLKGLRPLLLFDCAFDELPHMALVKEMFIHTFGVPPAARKSKPFTDHVLSFAIVDGKVWVRNYQIEEGEEGGDIKLVEIGPRFVLTLITILEGSFGGPKIYENRQYVLPNFVRAQVKHQQSKEAAMRAEKAVQAKVRRREQVLEADPLGNDAVFK